jgi:hypothetical protein
LLSALLGLSRNETRSLIARGRAVFDSQAKFESENVMADVYLAIAIAGANTLIVMGIAIAFVII